MIDQARVHAARATERLDAAVPADRSRAAGLLRAGGLVAMPTETVYGLAADALQQRAVESIFAAKDRPGWDPLIVHIAHHAMLPRVAAVVSAAAQQLMDAFWPGPLTLLLPRTCAVPDAVTAGRALVGVRMPDHPVALALLQEANTPLAAPSANRFGHTSPSTAQHVLDDLDGRIDAVLDGGPCRVGVESTVFDPHNGVVYRQGRVSVAELESVLGTPVTVYVAPALRAEPESLPSPGVGIRHYAPRARLQLVSNPLELEAEVRTLSAQGRAAGVMLPTDWTVEDRSSAVRFAWGRWDRPAELAQRLYLGLRALDDAGVEVIVCPEPQSSALPLVAALRDRLQKAARPA